MRDNQNWRPTKNDIVIGLQAFQNFIQVNGHRFNRLVLHHPAHPVTHNSTQYGHLITAADHQPLDPLGVVTRGCITYSFEEFLQNLTRNRLIVIVSDRTTAAEKVFGLFSRQGQFTL